MFYKKNMSLEIWTRQVHNFENPAKGDTKEVRKESASHHLILKHPDAAVKTLQAAKAPPD